jgi:hypothetical protein
VFVFCGLYWLRYSRMFVFCGLEPHGLFLWFWSAFFPTKTRALHFATPQRADPQLEQT